MSALLLRYPPSLIGVIVGEFIGAERGIGRAEPHYVPSSTSNTFGGDIGRL